MQVRPLDWSGSEQRYSHRASRTCFSCFPLRKPRFKASSLETKLCWVRQLRELIKDRILQFEIPRLQFSKTIASSDSAIGTGGSVRGSESERMQSER